MAVYKAGVKAGFWEGVDQSGASEMMNYIFPKSGNIAYYNLVMELMRKAHGMFLGGVFYLFKLPAQIERMIMDYLKKEKMDVASLGDDADAYLQSMDTIATDHCFTTVPTCTAMLVTLFQLSSTVARVDACVSFVMA